MENTEISLATIQDVVKLQHISRETFFQAFSDINTEENMAKYLNESFSTEQLSAELNNPLSQFFFAKLNGEVIAYMKLNTGAAQKENPDGNGIEIERIYVLKEFHGKKVAQLLYTEAIEVAKKQAVAYVWLGVWEENHRALAFYRKNGFVEFGQHAFMLGDDKQTDLLMKKVMDSEA